MDKKDIKEKIKIARKAVEDEEEPYRTEAFKIIFARLLESDKITPKNIKRAVSRKSTEDESNWYEAGSTIDKIIKLIDKGFFNKNRTISEIVGQLKSTDYHYKSTDLTLPLRKIVRKGLLLKTKDLPDGSKSKYWAYIKA